MNPKEHCCQLFDDRSIPNEETRKVKSYFSDLYFILSDDTGSFLGQAVHVLERIVIEENGDLAAILNRCREALSPYIPSEGIADLDQVDWQWIGIEYLYLEVFDQFEDQFEFE